MEGGEDVVALVVLNMVLVLAAEDAETKVETRVCHCPLWGTTYCLLLHLPLPPLRQRRSSNQVPREVKVFTMSVVADEGEYISQAI